MENNKKDYLLKTLGLQFVICALIFGLLLFLSENNSSLYAAIKDLFSARLEKNLSVNEVEDVFNNIGGLTDSYYTDNAPETEQSEEAEESTAPSAEVFSGGADIKTENNKLPENVSLKKYRLDKTMTVPVKGEVTSEFGFRIHPITGEKGFHSGIDLAAPSGSPIHAAFDGVVVYAGFDQWNGNHLKIMHGDEIMTVYCHCSELFVEKGCVVRAGEIIAAVGSTGSSTGPHLHFELRINDISFNPQYALKTAVYAI